MLSGDFDGVDRNYFFPRLSLEASKASAQTAGAASGLHYLASFAAVQSLGSIRQRKRQDVVADMRGVPGAAH